MQNEGSNYKHVSIGSLKDIKRQELHEVLALSGVEVSLNRMAAGQAVPFVHSHKQNEEVYVVLEGKGTFVIDGDEIEVGEGSCCASTRRASGRSRRPMTRTSSSSASRPPPAA